MNRKEVIYLIIVLIIIIGLTGCSTGTKKSRLGGK